MRFVRWLFAIPEPAQNDPVDAVMVGLRADVHERMNRLHDELRLAIEETIERQRKPE